MPGTTSIVYGGTFATVTNGDGFTFPRYRMQLITDAANAVPGPLDGTPPLAWHQVPTGSDSPPLYTDAPNQDMIEGFTH